MSFTATDKRICAERELMMRKRIYPRWVQQGKMKLDNAQYEIDVMRAIAEDYAKLEHETKINFP